MLKCRRRAASGLRSEAFATEDLERIWRCGGEMAGGKLVPV